MPHSELPTPQREKRFVCGTTFSKPRPPMVMCVLSPRAGWCYNWTLMCRTPHCDGRLRTSRSNDLTDSGWRPSCTGPGAGRVVARRAMASENAGQFRFNRHNDSFHSLTTAGGRGTDVCGAGRCAIGHPTALVVPNTGQVMQLSTIACLVRE
jgi:hypothetical protein